MMLFLVGREKATISELAERFEVSKKTVEREREGGISPVFLWPAFPFAASEGAKAESCSTRLTGLSAALSMTRK